LQIYGDFSGYSDIARGISKLMGFELTLNFRLPYFAITPSDFWRRWHVSLSSWLRDYLYIPLGGNRGGTAKMYRNLALTMLLGGLWHGAAWNFVLWGAFHGVLLIAYRVLDVSEAHPRPGSRDWRASEVLPKMALMFVLTMIGWVLFRCHSATQVWGMLSGMGFSTSGNTHWMLVHVVVLWAPLLVAELWQYWRHDLLVATRLPTPVLLGMYCGIALLLSLFGSRSGTEFIYFQF
jgi:D-alanyl-lipoteichoic acid acyltransferase DltB (MBOAT superfamily)